MSDYNLINVTGNSNEDLRIFMEEDPEGLVEKRYILCEIHFSPKIALFTKQLKENAERPKETDICI